MPADCLAPALSQRLHEGANAVVSYLGGSITVGTAPGITMERCWRVLFTEYLQQSVAPRFGATVVESNASIGALKSTGAVFTLSRNVLSKDPSLVFVEFCVNDRTTPNKEMVRMSMEGIARRLRQHPTAPDIVFLGAGARPDTDDPDGGPVDHSIHRGVAEHYGIPFIDMHEFLLKRLPELGKTWDDIKLTDGDHLHYNEFGNQLWFEHLRDWFEEQLTRYAAKPVPPTVKPLPPALYSDGLEHIELTNPSLPDDRITLEGSWNVIAQSEGNRSWIYDDLLEGFPGDKLTFKFNGAAIALISRAYSNGLKLEAVLDGKEVVGPFTNYKHPYTGYDLIKHGLPDKEHVLELTVGTPLRRLNKEPNPSARIAFLAVASHGDADSFTSTSTISAVPPSPKARE